MAERCKECSHVGAYTTGPFARNPHYCCELIWELFKIDYKVLPDIVDPKCPLKNSSLSEGIAEYSNEFGCDDE